MFAFELEMLKMISQHQLEPLAFQAKDAVSVPATRLCLPYLSISIQNFYQSLYFNKEVKILWRYCTDHATIWNMAVATWTSKIQQ